MSSISAATIDDAVYQGLVVEREHPDGNGGTLLSLTPAGLVYLRKNPWMLAGTAGLGGGETGWFREDETSDEDDGTIVARAVRSGLLADFPQSDDDLGDGAEVWDFDPIHGHRRNRIFEYRSGPGGTSAMVRTDLAQCRPVGGED